MKIQNAIINSSLLLRHFKVFNAPTQKAVSVVKIHSGDLPYMEFERFATISALIWEQSAHVLKNARLDVIQQIKKDVESKLLSLDNRPITPIQTIRFNPDYRSNCAIFCGGREYSQMMQSWQDWNMQWQQNYDSNGHVGMLDRFPLYVIGGFDSSVLVDLNSAAMCNIQASVKSTYIDDSYHVSVVFSGFGAIQKATRLEL